MNLLGIWVGFWCLKASALSSSLQCLTKAGIHLMSSSHRETEYGFINL